jgi:hypothetical protein
VFWAVAANAALFSFDGLLENLSIFSNDILKFPKNSDSPLDCFSDEIFYRGQNERLYLGQNRRNTLGLGFWGDLYGYGGTVRPKHSVFQKSSISDMGVLLGIDFPARRGDYFSTSFYYNFSSPTQELHLPQNPYFNTIKEETTNHLFGFRFSHYDEGLFTLFGINGGFDRYKFPVNNFGKYEGGGWQLGAYSEFELDVNISNTWTLKPHLMFDYRWLHQGRIDNSSFTLFQSETHNAFYTDFGVRLIHQFYPVLDWQARLSWLHDFLKSDPIYVQRFSGISGFTTPSLLFFDGSNGTDWLWFGTGLKFHYGNFLNAFLDYDLWFNKYMTTHTGSLSVVLTW